MDIIDLIKKTVLRLKESFEDEQLDWEESPESSSQDEPEVSNSTSAVSKVFEDWIPKALRTRLNDKFKEDRKTHAGQLKILDLASKGDQDAALYLYIGYIKLTYSVFWKYYVGPDKSLGIRKFLNGDPSSLPMKAYEILSGKNKPNPYSSFKTDLYSEDTDMIKQFGWWYRQFLRQAYIQIWKEEVKGGMHGNLTSDNKEISTSSYEEYHADRDEEASEADFSDNVELSMIFKEFKKWLEENKKADYVKIFNLRSQGLSLSDTAKEMGQDIHNVRSKWVNIQKWFEEKYPNLNQQ